MQGLIVSLFFFARTSLAWSCDGHMVVAQLALSSGIMSATTLQKAKGLVDFLNAQYPRTGATFQEVACWADDIRSSEGFGNWHFIDIPVCRLANPSKCTPPPPDNNAVWAVEESEETLTNSSATLDKARMLRFAIHIIGDIHQPLHAASYFSTQFPTGDLGGNKWQIGGVPFASELHALWDEGLGLFYQQLRRPLNTTGFDWVGSLADRVLGLHPVASLQPQIAEKNVTQWALESHAIAEDFVYSAPQKPTPIPAEYLQGGQDIVLKQLAIAGYRLADTLCVGGLLPSRAGGCCARFAIFPHTLLPLPVLSSPKPAESFFSLNPKKQYTLGCLRQQSDKCIVFFIVCFC